LIVIIIIIVIVTSDKKRDLESRKKMASSCSGEKRVMVLAMDEHEHSNYALEWTLDRFFTPFGADAPYNLVIINAKPSPPPAVTMAGPGN